MRGAGKPLRRDRVLEFAAFLEQQYNDHFEDFCNLYKISISFLKSFSFLILVMTITMPLQKKKVWYS